MNTKNKLLRFFVSLPMMVCMLLWYYFTWYINLSESGMIILILFSIVSFMIMKAGLKYFNIKPQRKISAIKYIKIRAIIDFLYAVIFFPVVWGYSNWKMNSSPATKNHFSFLIFAITLLVTTLLFLVSENKIKKLKSKI